jgi:hypothetical protein
MSGQLKNIIRFAIDCIKINDLETLNFYLLDKQYVRFKNSPYVFIQLFNNACLYQKLDIIKWLYTIYQDYEIVEKIAIKPTFNYCYCIQKDDTIKEYLKSILKDIKF